MVFYPSFTKRQCGERNQSRESNNTCQEVWRIGKKENQANRREKKKTQPTSKRLFSFWKHVSGKKIFSFGLGVRNCQLPMFVPKEYSGSGVLTAGEYRELVGLWGDHTTVVRLGIQSSMTRNNMGKSWRLKGFAGPSSLGSSAAACSFWAANRHALGLLSFPDELQLCTCQFIGRGNPPLMVSIPPLVPPP